MESNDLEPIVDTLLSGVGSAGTAAVSKASEPFLPMLWTVFGSVNQIYTVPHGTTLCLRSDPLTVSLMIQLRTFFNGIPTVTAMDFLVRTPPDALPYVTRDIAILFEVSNLPLAGLDTLFSQPIERGVRNGPPSLKLLANPTALYFKDFSDLRADTKTEIRRNMRDITQNIDFIPLLSPCNIMLCYG